MKNRYRAVRRNEQVFVAARKPRMTVTVIKDFFLDDEIRSRRTGPETKAVDARLSPCFEYDRHRDVRLRPLARLPPSDAFEVASAFERGAEGVGEGLADEAEGVEERRLAGAVAADKEGDVVEDEADVGERPVVAEPKLADSDLAHQVRRRSQGSGSSSE
jgi:hypothetical protein